MLSTEIIDFHFFNSKSLGYGTGCLHCSHEWWALNNDFIKFHLVFLKKLLQKLTCKYGLHGTLWWKGRINSVHPSIIFFINSPISSLSMSYNSKKAVVLNSFMFLNIRFLLIIKKFFELFSLRHGLARSKFRNS